MTQAWAASALAVPAIDAKVAGLRLRATDGEAPAQSDAEPTDTTGE